MNFNISFKEIVIFLIKSYSLVFLLYQDNIMFLLLILTKQKDLIMKNMVRFIDLIIHNWK